MGRPIPPDPRPRRSPFSPASGSSSAAPPDPPSGRVDHTVHADRPQVNTTADSHRLPLSLGLAPPDVTSTLPARGASGQAGATDDGLPSLSLFESAPPPVPFDSPSPSSTAGWSRWLDERRTARRAWRGSRPTVPAPSAPSTTYESAAASLQRLRESAEQLRGVETRLEDVRRSTSSVAHRLPPATLSASGPSPTRSRFTASSSSFEPLSSFTGSLDQPRRALEEVRQRLDDSRRQVAAAASDAEQRPDEALSLTERAEASARESLERTVDFATRLDQLAQTLNAIAQRATALSPDLDTLTSDASPSSPDSLASASRTDSMRHTIRQLILASRRVSAAVDRHRESVASASAAAAPAPASPPAPAPAVHARMPVILPSPIAQPFSASFLAPPDPLSSPSRRFTASPLPLSPLSPAPPAPRRENYAGEHAQLERIAALQRDIQYRASELRQLRLRGRELEREGRRVALGEAGTGAAGGGEGDEGEKEEEEDDEGDGHAEVREGGAPLARALRLPHAELFAGASEPAPRRQRVAAADYRAEGTGAKRSSTVAEARRDYEVWAFCGR